MGTDLQVTEKQVRIIIFFKNKFTQYKSPQNTDNNNTICNLRRNVYMKATGDVASASSGRCSERKEA